MTAKTPPSPKPTAPNSPTQAEPAFGWNRYAETINGRFAMVGFVALLLLEFFTRQDFFTWLGIR
ncbi:high light inducible protein [Microcoleus sp. LEGE 07076]|uniref:chlorophyll a/b-binding protein n=1 Tax=Microcoleus sp. LEGE 07076 TaxID=915322 RepID=UPI00187E30B2|nr:chlorophyll a/b-binding protein [Microcoleus sp. LEGE 07076]MBE9188089.1 high light inducible protein [Microcoleus sp. LEGE 07076]